MADSKISALTDGTTPAGTDEFPVSRSGGITRKLTWTSLLNAVKAVRLDQFAAPTAAVPLGAQKITGLAAATVSTDAASLANSLDQFTAPAANVAMNAKKITGLANGTTATDAAAFGQIPTIFPCLWFAAASFVSSVVGTWARSSDTATTGVPVTATNWANGSTHAINDACTWDLGATLPAGTYNFEVQIQKNSGGAIFTFETSPDGVTWSSFTTVDGYNASTTYAIVQTTGIAAASAFRYFRVRAATKNASSNNYYLILTYLALARTA